MSIFVSLNRKPSIIRKISNFQIIRGLGYRLMKMDTGCRFCRSNSWIEFHQSGKFLLSRKFRVDNFECHAITVIEKRLKTPKMKFDFYFIHCRVFWHAKMTIFVGRDRKTSVIQKFPGLSRISDSAAGFPWGRLRWDSLSEFGASPIAPPIALLRPGKINQIHHICGRR